MDSRFIPKVGPQLERDERLKRISALMRPNESVEPKPEDASNAKRQALETMLPQEEDDDQQDTPYVARKPMIPDAGEPEEHLKSLYEDMRKDNEVAFNAAKESISSPEAQDFYNKHKEMDPKVELQNVETGIKDYTNNLKNMLKSIPVEGQKAILDQMRSRNIPPGSGEVYLMSLEQLLNQYRKMNGGQ